MRTTTVIFEGGLGNQLFQYTFMVYLRECRGLRVKYDRSFYEVFSAHDGFQADKVFDFSCFKERRWKHHSSLGKKIERIYQKTKGRKMIGTEGDIGSSCVYPSYFGFWQDLKYYSPVKGRLKEGFKGLDGYCAAPELRQEMRRCQSVMIHVRRGDYLSAGNEKKYVDLAGTQYYRRAIEYMQARVTEPVFFVFSDDIEWTKEYFGEYEGFHFVQYQGQTALSDLALMQACSHAVIANSSFSWWGASLDTKGEVAYPAAYYTPRYAREIPVDLYPEDWARIRVE